MKIIAVKVFQLKQLKKKKPEKNQDLTGNYNSFCQSAQVVSPVFKKINWKLSGALPGCYKILFS